MQGQSVGSGERFAPLWAKERRGVTLVELMVALALLGLILGISTLAVASLRPPAGSEIKQAVQRARAEAIRTGVPVSTARYHSPLPTVLFLPDGRAVGINVDPLTGAFHAAR